MVDHARRVCRTMDDMVGNAPTDIPQYGKGPRRTQIQRVAPSDGLDTTVLGTLLPTAIDNNIEACLSPFEDLRKFF